MFLPGMGLAFDQCHDTDQDKCYNDTVEIPCPAEGDPPSEANFLILPGEGYFIQLKQETLGFKP